MTPHRRPLLAGALLVLAVALAFRLVPTTPFVTWDEPTWTYRSLKFLRGLETGRLEQTRQSAHPGVPTMWSGAAGIALASATGREAEADRAWVDELPDFDEDDTALVDRLAPFWPAARRGVAVATSLLVALAFLLAARLLPLRSALAGGLLLAIDPYLLAHSRLLHLDALLSLFYLTSVLATAASVRAGGTLVLAALGGALGGLAVAEKSPGAVVVPAAVFVVLLAVLLPRGGTRLTPRRALSVLAVWAASAATVYAVAWPAAWVAPVETLGTMVRYAVESAGGPREAVFFASRVQPDPGIALYLATVAFRLAPLALLGLLCAVPALRRGGPERRTIVALLAASALYALAMGAGAKKFERYVLPAVPLLLVVAGHGLAWMAVSVGLRRPRLRPDALLGALLLAQAVWVAAHAPYYLALYNPLLGGGRAAARVLPVGWGEGMDRAAAYLNALPGAADLVVATPSVTLLAPLFQGTTVPASRAADADYAVLYIDDVQIGRPDLAARLPRERTPVHVVRLGGIDYAWVYELTRDGGH